MREGSRAILILSMEGVIGLEEGAHCAKRTECRSIETTMVLYETATRTVSRHAKGRMNVRHGCMRSILRVPTLDVARRNVPINLVFTGGPLI